MSKRLYATYRSFFGGGGGVDRGIQARQGGTGGSSDAGVGPQSVRRAAGVGASAMPAAGRTEHRRRGGRSDKPWFNPEDFTAEKRQWVAMQKAQGIDGRSHRRPVTAPFEFFVVAGLPTSADVSGVAASAKAAREAREAGVNFPVSQPKSQRFYRGTSGETFPAEVLFSYPPGERIPIDNVDAFCFPHGVEPKLLERTPSMSAMNDIVYGQQHLQADDKSFVFTLRAGENETLYGVCCYVSELVQRQPGMIVAANEAMAAAAAGNKLDGGEGGTASRSAPPPLSRYLIAADRCYCLISRVPFFSLHFEVLHSILGMERLERIRACVEQMMEDDATDDDAMRGDRDAGAGSGGDTIGKQSDSASSTGTGVSPLVSRRLSFDSGGTATPEGAGSAFGSPTEPNVPVVRLNPLASRISKGATKGGEAAMISEDGFGSPIEVSSSAGGGVRGREGGVDGEEAADSPSVSDEVPVASTTTNGPAFVSAVAHDFNDPEYRAAVDALLARSCDSLKILTEYRKLPLPALGDDVVFAPLDSLKPLTFTRRVPDELPGSGSEAARAVGAGESASGAPGVAEANDRVGKAAGVSRVGDSAGAEEVERSCTPDPDPTEPTWKSPSVTSRSNGSAGSNGAMSRESDVATPVHCTVSAPEEAVHLETWTVAALCRCLSLENVLSVLNGALLERQMVVLCPNLGELSAVVLSITALLRPLQWQSLMLPVLPQPMISFLDAPVPFVVGVQHKTAEVRQRSTHLSRVNVYKDEVKLHGSVPALPRLKELTAVLQPLHAAVQDAMSSSHRHPIAEPSPTARRASRAFLVAWREYLRALVANLRAYAITDVNSHAEKVSILLKDSFVDSFGRSDRPFMRAFCETQMFDVFADEQLKAP